MRATPNRAARRPIGHTLSVPNDWHRTLPNRPFAAVGKLGQLWPRRGERSSAHSEWNRQIAPSIKYSAGSTSERRCRRPTLDWARRAPMVENELGQTIFLTTESEVPVGVHVF